MTSLLAAKYREAKTPHKTLHPLLHREPLSHCLWPFVPGSLQGLVGVKPGVHHSPLYGVA